MVIHLKFHALLIFFKFPLRRVKSELMRAKWRPLTGLTAETNWVIENRHGMVLATVNRTKKLFQSVDLSVSFLIFLKDSMRYAFIDSFQ